MRGVAIAAALAFAPACSDDGNKSDRPAPAPEPEPEPEPESAPAAAPEPAGPPAPQCRPVQAGLDIEALCGQRLKLEVVEGDGSCSLVVGPDSPRGMLVRVDVERTEARRLPARYPAAGVVVDRGPVSTARRGAYPWLIEVRSRGSEEAPCAGDAIGAVAARVAELLPPDPDAGEAPPNPACEKILDAARIRAACGARLEALAVDPLEGAGEHVCRRYSERRQLTFSISRGSPSIEPGDPVLDRRGNLAIAGAVGPYALELRLSRAIGSGALVCDRRQLTRLFSGVMRRTRRVLGKK